MLALVATLLVAAAEAPPSQGALGAWSANGARVELKQEEGKIVGLLGAEAGSCPLAAGTEVLRGTLLDDSLSAQVRLCLVAPACGADPGSALAVLLVTRQLTGGVHAKAVCAADVRALVLRRPGVAPLAMTAPPPTERLSHTAAPRAPRIAPGAREETARDTPKSARHAAEETPIGQTPGRPVGGDRGPGYDPRDARRAATPPGEADRLLTLGKSYLDRGQHERARKAFREAIAADPQRAEGYNGVGVTFYARGDYDEALAWYKRSLDADPRVGDAFYNIACIYALKGRKALALRYLKLAALNHYSAPEQLEQDTDLASLRGDPGLAEILAQMDAEARPAAAGRP